jgi:flagellar M-ring protein FliF
MPVVDVERLKEHGKRFVDGFTPGQKAMTILGVVGVVLVGSVFMKWASTPSYAPLFSGLSSQDAGAVTQQLQSQGIKYKVTQGGATIMVPQQMVDQTRISLSAKGIPAGGDSFTLLDKAGITTDQFTRNVDYQRALQGELSKTIQSISQVQSANVTLTIPQDNTFVGGTEDKPTAAVLVKTGGRLDDSAVQAIAHLVASSIPNMSSDDVTIADSNGNMLHAPGMNSSLASGTQLEAQNTYEATLEQKIENMINAAYGPGHAAVTVNAQLDNSTTNKKSTTYTRPATNAGGAISPTDVPAQSNTSSETLNSPGATGTNGVAGVGFNGNIGTGGTGTGQSYQKNTTNNTNALDTTNTNSDIPPGTVQRESVSVLLDSTVNPDLVKLRNQIAAAAGINPTRDGATALQVNTVAFTQEAQKAAKAANSGGGGGSNAMFDLIKSFLTFLIVGLVLFFAWKAIKRAEANRVPLRVPIDLRELEAPALAAALASPAGGGAAAVAGGAAGGARRSLEPPPQTLEGEITDLIERQPDEVAQTLRSWLADRRS